MLCETNPQRLNLGLGGIAAPVRDSQVHKTNSPLSTVRRGHIAISGVS
jgi:hypothetical protein